MRGHRAEWCTRRPARVRGARHVGRRLRLRPRVPGRGRGAGSDAEDGRRHGPARRADALPPGGPGRHALARRHRRPGAPRAVPARRAPGRGAGRRLVPAALRRRRRRPPPRPGPPRLRRRRRSASTACRSTSSGPTACPTPPPATSRSSSSRSRSADAAGDRPVGAIVLEPDAARGREPGVLARLPVAGAGVAVRRVAADDVLDQPQRVVRVPATGSPTPTRTSGGCATTSSGPTRRCTRSAASATPPAPRTTTGSCAPPAPRRAIGWSVYDFDVTASSVWARLRS